MWSFIIDSVDAHILCLILHMVWDFNQVLCTCSSCNVGIVDRAETVIRVQ